MTSIFIGIMTTSLLLTGCSPVGGASGTASSPSTITVAAAISLSDALKDVATQFKQKNPDINVQFTYGASGVLQQQIEQGSPIDLFISAGEKQMDALKTKGLVLDKTVKPLVENKVVLIVPSNKEGPITSFTQLSQPSIAKIALGNPKTVPAGQYGKEVLEYYHQYELNQGKLVFAEDVRQSLTMVATGNADAGIVYSTDAKSNKNVKIVAEAPAESHQKVLYPMAIVKASKQQAGAQAFEAFCLSADGQKIFEQYGFGLPK